MFSKFFIERPVFASVLSLLIVLLGGVAFYGLPVEQYPELAPPVVRVEALYPGANAQTVVDTVAAPLEQEVNGVDRMLYMNSNSSDGRYALDITFEVGTDVDMAAVLVQNRVSVAESRLPEDVRRLGVTTRKQSTAMVGVISLWSESGEYDDVFIANYMTINMKDEISRIFGVGGLQIVPAKEYGMRVWLDPERLKARNLTVADVHAAVRAQNVQVAAGAIGRQPAPAGQDFELIVNTQGRLTTVEQFEQIVLKVVDNRAVRLRDVARVELGARDYGTGARFNGKPAGVMVIYQLPGANLVDVAARVDATLHRMQREFPTGLQGKFFYDSSMFIRASLGEVRTTLIEAFVLVFVVVLIFLQSLRTTIIPALTIPVSLIGTFAFLLLFGFSINMLTMFALVLAIGIVVDDAIVVVENVERNLREHGLSPREATLRAMQEIFGPIVAITLVLMSVFLPSAALPGITGQMYRQFALTIAASTGISAVCALTLSPALCAILLTRHNADQRGPLLLRPLRWLADGFNALLDGLTRGYAGVTRVACRAALLTILILGGVYYFSFEIYQRVPGGFVPNEDLGFVIVAIQLPDGAAFERTDAVVEAVEQQLQQVPGVRDVTALSGFSVMDGIGSNFGTCWVVLDDWDERAKHAQGIPFVMGAVGEITAKFEQAQMLVFSLPAISGLGNTSGFDLRVQNKQPDSITREQQQELVQQLIGDAMGQTRAGGPTLLAAFSSFRAGVPQLFLDIDREKVMRLGIPLEAVFETLQTSLGSAYINDFNLFNRTFQVNVQADARFRLQPQDILRLEVRNRDGAMIPINTFTSVKETIGPDRIARYNMYPAATINGIPAPGVSSGQSIAMMEQLAAHSLPAGMGFEWTGMSLQEKLAGGQALAVFGLALLVVYLILAAQYESWATPLAVVLSVPLVLIGAMLALELRGLDNNIFTQIGLVLLIGLGAKNAILIVEFARDGRARGLTIVEAAVNAARTRFRPIVMTSLAFILGVVPLVLASGAGAASRQALGTAVFGGMIGNTLLGLLFTPALYVLVQTIAEALRGFGKSHVQEMPVEPSGVHAAAQREAVVGRAK